MKCVRYWGLEENVPTEHGHFKVTLTSEDVYAEYTVRRIQLELKV